MYRFIFVFILSLISFQAFPQRRSAELLLPPQLPVDNSTNKITYEYVVEVPATSAEELYQRALQWFRSNYKNPSEVIRENDSVQKKIVGKPRFRISNPPNKDGTKTDAGVVQYTITISARDGRFKFELTDFNWKQVSNYPCERWYDKDLPSYSKAYDEYIRQTDNNIQSVIGSLKNAMTNEKASKKDNW